jgi:hypothetical protein
MKVNVKPAAILILILLLCSGNAWADSFMLEDDFIGAGATSSRYADADVIGNPDDFDILGLNAMVTSDLFKVEIYSTYFDSGSITKYGTALGDLFVSIDGYSGEGEDWEYVAVLDGHDHLQGGMAYLYGIQSGSVLYSQELINPNYIFRSGQEVLFASQGDAIATGTWGIDDNWLSIHIAGEAILPVVTEVGFHYAMTCGNDVIEGGVDVAPVPEPATMVLLGTGLIGLAGISRRQRRKTAKE